MNANANTSAQDLDDDSRLLMKYAMAVGGANALLLLATRDYLSKKVAKKIVAEAAELKQDIDMLKDELEARIAALEAARLRDMVDRIEKQAR